jgi:hypothetical protein
MIPLQFHPTQVFDETKHVVDVVAKEYLKKATDDMHHLIPVDVPADGNCLYHSMVLLMNDPSVTTNELRGIQIYFSFMLSYKFFLNNFLVRTIIELITNENHYQTMYSQYCGLIDVAIKAICKNYIFSELYEIAALCNVLQCSIRSVYPKIDFQYYMAIWDTVFTPVPPILSNCNIAILWSHALNEKNAREANNGTWSPNHFVPLVSPGIHNDSNNGNRSMSLAVVSYTSVSGNSRILKIFFRLLKKERLKIMLLLK